jgi:predicted heme/steroid binding protein
LDKIKTINMLLAVNDDTGPSYVATTGDHNDVAGIQLNEVGDLVLLDVELDSDRRP